MTWIYRNLHSTNHPLKCGYWFVIKFGNFRKRAVRAEYLSWWEVGQELGGN